MSRRNTLNARRKKAGQQAESPRTRGRSRAQREPQPHTDEQVTRRTEPRFPSVPLEVRDGPPPPGPEQRRERALRALIDCGSRMAKESRDPDWDYLLQRARETGGVPWT